MKKILIGSAIFVSLYNLLFYPTVPGIGLGLLFLFVHAYLFSVRNKNAKHLSFALLQSAFSIMFATLIGLRANGVVQFFDILVALFLSFTAGYFYKKETQFSPTVFPFLFIPFSAFLSALLSINTFFSNHKLKKPSEKHADLYNAIFRGVAIAVPILIILFLLLSGADPIFKKIAGNFSFSVSTQVIISAILFIFCFVWGITVIKDRPSEKSFTENMHLSGEKLAVESLIVTGSAAFLFALFLLIQLRFLFLQVPETDLQSLGINIQTYSEYVRQGFFQLLFAAAIATSIIAFVLQSFPALGTKHKLYLKISMLLLTLETELLLLSAGKRLFLYEQAHGLTRSRIFSAVFLLWLSLLLFMLFISILKKTRIKHFFSALFFITAGSFAALNIIPIDSLIATRYPPTINSEIDYIYLTGLSSEASPVWPNFIMQAENQWNVMAMKKRPTEDEFRRSQDLVTALSSLNGQVYYLDRKYTKDPKNFIPLARETSYKNENVYVAQRWWQAFNFSEYNAYLLVQQNRSLFLDLKPLIESMDKKITEWTNQNR